MTHQRKMPSDDWRAARMRIAHLAAKIQAAKDRRMNAFDDVSRALEDEPRADGDARIIAPGVPYVRVGPTEVSLQFTGWELVLLPDGTYFLNATDGG